MKKTLAFEKDLPFGTMIGDVTTIEIDSDLKFISKSDIEGKFYISGKYKMHEASVVEEDFSFNVPISISMTEDYEVDTTSIMIGNFTYEVIDDSILRCKIDVVIDGRLEIVSDVEEVNDLKEEKEEVRECDSDIIDDKDKEIPIKEKKEEADISKERNEELEEYEEKEDIGNKIKVNSLFANLGDDLDTFTTYSVYIMREGDSLEKVMDKYQVKKEDLQNYNDLSTIELNSKVIIPSSRIDE